MAEALPTTTPHNRVQKLSEHVTLQPNLTGSSSSNPLDFAVFNPKTASGKNPCQLKNFINGEWKTSAKNQDIPDPLNGEAFIKMPDTGPDEVGPFLQKMAEIPKSGLHNPIRNVNRYTMYGEISFQLAKQLDDPVVCEHFAKCIQRVVPKSYVQAVGEVKIVAAFLKNFCADQVRFLARGFTVSGDHDGQESKGYRWPFGAVCIIAPFNFPLEIPVLQLMGALYCLFGFRFVLRDLSCCEVLLSRQICRQNLNSLPVHQCQNKKNSPTIGTWVIM